MEDAEVRRLTGIAEARDRTRRLHHLIELLSSAVEESAVLSAMVSAGRDALGAEGGSAWMLRGDGKLELAAADLAEAADTRLRPYRTIGLTDGLPVCDVVQTRSPLLFETLAAMQSIYPRASPGPGSHARAWAVLPLVAGDDALGAISFSFLEERTFREEDRELLATMIGQASLALARCRLIASERRARQRERQLHVLASRLSAALTPVQVAEIASREARAAVDARACVVAIPAGDATAELLAVDGVTDAADWTRIPVDGAFPVAVALRTSALVWASGEEALARDFAVLEDVWRGRGVQAWGAVPFAFEGRSVGAIGLSCGEPRELDDDDRGFLIAVGQLVGQALERARLFEAHRVSEERLRLALSAARAGTWMVDLTTMRSTRDPSYLELLGIDAATGDADFAAVHPDDRAIARAHYDRALREGVPYEPEVRIRRGDGSYAWFRSHGRVVHDRGGKPTVMTGVIFDIDAAKRASLRAEEERRIKETLYRLGASFAHELDPVRLAQLISDEVTPLVSADVGAFFAAGHAAETVLARSGPRVELAAELRAGGGAGTLRSRLAVTLVGRSGEVFGTLAFGHVEPDRFTAEHEELARSVAGQAAIALENARLYRALLEQKDALEGAVERALAADRRKDEFLAMLGHELRNPLAPIVTALGLIARKDDGRILRERDVIGRQVEHLTRLVDDLLDVSRITRGKISLTREVVEVGSVLAHAIEVVTPLLDRRGQNLGIAVPASGLLVDADPTRLGQVFQNLLVNASKYSERGAAVDVCARADAGTVVVEVRDSGSGIAPELLPRLFDLFVQGERDIDRSAGGLGIGLSIAKSLCELHGGRISASSEGRGRGSTFTVRLPRVVRTETSPPRSTSQPPRTSRRSIRVLVVDDNVDAAMMLRDYLAALGHDVGVAHDGAAALTLAASLRPEVAVLDIGLPKLDGYALARALRDRLGREPLRLIAVTGYGQEHDRARAHAAGFDHHLVKPVAPESLTSLLER